MSSSTASTTHASAVFRALEDGRNATWPFAGTG
jgi:hypothetical protein